MANHPHHDSVECLSFERLSHGSIIIHPCVVAIAPCTNIHTVLADPISAAREQMTVLRKDANWV